MTDSPIIPGAHGAPLAPDGRWRAEWYRFLRDLANRTDAALSAELTALAARVDAIENESSFVAQLNGIASVVVTGSLVSGVVNFTLAGDSTSPGATYYYGTNPAGAKGWYALHMVPAGGSTGQALTKASASDYDATWQTPSSGGALVKIAEVVAGSATTDIDFSSLDLDTDKLYVAEIVYVSNTTTVGDVALYYNGDTTAANYQRQVWAVSAAATLGQRASDALIIRHGGGTLGSTAEPTTARIEIKKVSGVRPYAYATNVANDTGNIYTCTIGHRRNNTANVTSLKLRNSVSNGFGVGTTVRLYREA